MLVPYVWVEEPRSRTTASAVGGGATDEQEALRGIVHLTHRKMLVRRLPDRARISQFRRGREIAMEMSNNAFSCGAMK